MYHLCKVIINSHIEHITLAHICIKSGGNKLHILHKMLIFFCICYKYRIARFRALARKRAERKNRSKNMSFLWNYVTWTHLFPESYDSGRKINCLRQFFDNEFHFFTNSFLVTPPYTSADCRNAPPAQGQPNSIYQ